jgi:16S rRNA (cytosine967-C5)-methyltransferase
MTPSARDIAVWALSDRAGNVSASLDRLLGRERLSCQDKALAHELALGACRRRGTLRLVAKAFLAQPDRRLPGALNEILDIALYQLLFLSRVPDFAAVNEAVDQAVRYHHRRQSGLVNGLLRTVARNISPMMSGLPPRSADVLPVSSDSYRKFSKPVFVDPQADPASYLSEAFSLPPVLAKRWLERTGGMEGAVGLATHANARPPLVVRVNALKAEAGKVISSLRAEGIQAGLHANGVSIVMDHFNVRELSAFHAGLIQPQDPTATAVVHAAQPRPGSKVLDLCAAPGTKTTHLAEMMGNRGSILAVDVSEEKLLAILNNCQRLGIAIVQTLPSDKLASIPPASFDLVLADVPCSNTGVLARRPEARWRFDEDCLAALIKDQHSLIASAAGFVLPGGRLVYSTCSIEPEECQDVAGWLPRHDQRMHMVREELTLPGGADDPVTWRDGGYLAVFEAV